MPSSSVVSRTAQAAWSASSASCLPPGNAICPACVDRSWRRSVKSSRSGWPGSLTMGTSTAAGAKPSIVDARARARGEPCAQRSRGRRSHDRKDLSRIQEIVGIEDALELALNAQERRRLLPRHVLHLREAHAVLAGERAAQRERRAHDGVDGVVRARRDLLVVDEQVDVQVAVAGVAVGGDRQPRVARRWRRSAAASRASRRAARRRPRRSCGDAAPCSVGLARRRVSHRSRRSRSFCATRTSTAPAASHACAQRSSAVIEPFGIAVELAQEHRAGAVGQAIGRAPAQMIDGRAIEQLERARPRAEVDGARHRRRRRRRDRRTTASSVCTAGGFGKSLSISSVATANVPSEPTIAAVTS